MTLNRERITPLAKDSLRVTINYRVGADGFLYLGDGITNLGLLDQIAALEWVRRTSGPWAGAPGKVTILRAIGGRHERRHPAVDAARQGSAPPSHRTKRDSP